MRDGLKNIKAEKYECGIVNLDSLRNEGSHWCCYFKNNDKKIYFDSFGIQPAREIVKCLKSPILYNTYQIQDYNDSNCGEWCVHVLNKLNKGGHEDFVNVILEIINNNK